MYINRKKENRLLTFYKTEYRNIWEKIVLKMLRTTVTARRWRSIFLLSSSQHKHSTRSQRYAAPLALSYTRNIYLWIPLHFSRMTFCYITTLHTHTHYYDGMDGIYCYTALAFTIRHHHTTTTTTTPMSFIFICEILRLQQHTPAASNTRTMNLKRTAYLYFHSSFCEGNWQ